VLSICDEIASSFPHRNCPTASPFAEPPSNPCNVPRSPPSHPYPAIAYRPCCFLASRLDSTTPSNQPNEFQAELFQTPQQQNLNRPPLNNPPTTTAQLKHSPVPPLNSLSLSLSLRASRRNKNLYPQELSPSLCSKWL